jgi:hypothetical protein
MRRILFAVFITLCLSSMAFATNYFGCNACTNPTSDTCWVTDPSATCASCTGTYVAWATVNAAGNNLYANGCTMAIPNTSSITISADKMSLAGAGVVANAVDGGTFTYTTSATNTLIVNPNLEGTGPTGTGASVITVSGSAAGLARVTFNGTVTGGNVSLATGISPSITNGEIVINNTITSGTTSSAYGLNTTGASAGLGLITINGNCVANTAIACRCAASGNPFTIYGDCIGSDTTDTEGCRSISTSTITLFGSTKDGLRGVGAAGNIKRIPLNATKYIYNKNALRYFGAGIGSDASGALVTGSNMSVEIPTTDYFIQPQSGEWTQGTKVPTTSGGGSWAY